MVTTPTRPKITPDLQAVFDAIQHMDKYHKVPPMLNNAGRLTPNVQALLEALEHDGFEAYRSERSHFFKDNEHAQQLFAVYSTPESKHEEEDKRFIPGKDGKRLIKLYSVEDIYSLPDPTYLIMGTLENIGLSLLYGMSGTGKTFSALNIALCVAHGLHWMGRRVKQGSVWYINTEGGRALKKRLKAWHQYYNLSPTSAFKIIPWSLDFREDFQYLLDTIEAMGGDEKPSLIIFDNFSMCTAGINQNLQEEVAPILRTLNGLADTYECHVMMLHHTNKEDDVNGTMAFRNHVDTMMQLKKEDKADKQSPILFCCQKARDDEPFSDIKTELKQVVLYADPDTGDPVTSCVVVASESPAKSEGLKDTAQNILDILGDRSLIHSDWQKECIEALRVSTATFDRYRKELVNKGYVEKYKPSDQKVDHYKKAVRSTENLAREISSENGGNNEQNI